MQEGRIVRGPNGERGIIQSGRIVPLPAQGARQPQGAGVPQMVVPPQPKVPQPQPKTVQGGHIIDPNNATATPVAGLPPEAPKALPGQEALDKAFAEEYVQWRTMGQSDATKGLEQLQSSADALTKKNLTGPLIGMAPDFINAWVNPDSIEAREAVEEVAQRNLRLILGGQFAMKEGEQLIARAYNPRLPEAINRKRVLRLIKQMQEAAEQKESAARYFEEKGTLNGWQGKLWTMSDFDPDGEGAVEGFTDDQRRQILEYLPQAKSEEDLINFARNISRREDGATIVGNPKEVLNYVRGGGDPSRLKFDDPYKVQSTSQLPGGGDEIEFLGFED